MKRDDLLDAIGGIDEDIKEESAKLRQSKKAKVRPAAVILPIAAALLLACGVIFAVMSNIQKNSTAEDGSDSSLADVFKESSSEEAVEEASMAAAEAAEEQAAAAAAARASADAAALEASKAASEAVEAAEKQLLEEEAAAAAEQERKEAERAAEEASKEAEKALEAALEVELKNAAWASVQAEISLWYADDDSAVSSFLYHDENIAVCRTVFGENEIGSRVELYISDSKTGENRKHINSFMIEAQPAAADDSINAEGIPEEVLKAAEDFWAYYKTVNNPSDFEIRTAVKKIRNLVGITESEENMNGTDYKRTEEEQELLRNHVEITYDQEAGDRYIPMMIAREFYYGNEYLLFTKPVFVMTLTVPETDDEHLGQMIKETFGNCTEICFAVSADTNGQYTRITPVSAEFN